MSELALQLIAENKAKHARGEDARVLDLGNCGLVEVPEEVFYCEWVEVLILSNDWLEYNSEKKEWSTRSSGNVGKTNEITFLPADLYRLSSLKTLIFNDNQISDLSPLTSISDLQILWCPSNQISDLGPISSLYNLRELHCSYNQISSLSDLKGLSNLQHLYCYSNNITDLSPLTLLSDLQYLDCSENQITDLSPASDLSNLRMLSFNSNPINNLSPISGLSNLHKLDCSSTQISELTPLSKLTQLEELNIWSTPVKDVSPIANLIKLKVLDASRTKIEDISPLANLKGLEKLYIAYTKVTDLEPLLDLIKQGIPVKWDEDWLLPKRIFVTECPLITPPPHIVKQGNTAILNYFAERQKLQFKNIEIKLILVGNSTAGKTSLSRFLRERVYQSGEPTTHGIKNDRWKPKGRELQVNLWDFGGQEYYHATHRLFLSQNAIYVLLWDAQTDKSGICETPIHFENDSEPSNLQLEHFPKKWWVQNIRHYTRESTPPVPILLVQNKCARDGIKRVSDEFEKPPFLLHPAWLDNHIDLENAGAHLSIKELEHGEWPLQFELFEKRLLDKLESQLAHFEFAIYHRDIRDKVRQLAAEGMTDMTYHDFEQLCREIEADAKMDLVQIYLRDITGDILYCPHNERLRGRVFLSPTSVCNSIYQILSRQVQSQNGIFGIDWVCEALRCDEKNALDFVELMREFELVFDDKDETGQSTGQWVAPQYLPENCSQSAYLEGLKKDKILTHAFILWFPDFLPKSHIARFVAHWGNQAEGRIFWKNGLLFKTEECKALVERTGEDKINVEILANHPNRIAALQHIFQSFMHLEDGNPGFAVSLDGATFVWWRDVQEALHAQAVRVKTYPAEPGNYTTLKPFLILQKQPNMTQPKKVFISYSKTDKDYLSTLKTQLSPLRRQGLITTWDDTDLKPGEIWDAAIRRELNAADIIILLVSADLIATDYVWEVEMTAALAREEATVVPVIIRPCQWQNAPFARLNALPEKGKPISTWANPDEAWAQVVGKIGEVL